MSRRLNTHLTALLGILALAACDAGRLFQPEAGQLDRRLSPNGRVAFDFDCHWTPDPSDPGGPPGDMTVAGRECREIPRDPSGGGGPSPDPGDGGGGGGGQIDDPPLLVADDGQQGPRPNCSKPETLTSPGQKAYCAGTRPDATQLMNIDRALTRLDQLGGVCATLAQQGRSMIADTTAIRLYPRSFDEHSGYGSVEGWLVLRSDMATDEKRLYPGKDQYGLDWVLAHELDHVLNHVEYPAATDQAGHVNGSGGVHTLNSKLCARIEENMS